ncbi:Uncharacterised protein [Campylobacter hyointestinalis subsp. hyointestinalis]|uniref:Uncharacterized protein n=1 Tax=Campylobacter hyointestinalis subsp. hyointestinalis TaxID=91352 RepID=A0A0S4SYT8_CAMHY|nr:hypothetical protein [Campylobacter hyointestinalis]CUU90725.1 Uncharacterised protein [Campylobacter hyointestinalis subsp. hyointestinalis]
MCATLGSSKNRSDFVYNFLNSKNNISPNEAKNMDEEWLEKKDEKIKFKGFIDYIYGVNSDKFDDTKIEFNELRKRLDGFKKQNDIFADLKNLDESEPHLLIEVGVVHEEALTKEQSISKLVEDTKTNGFKTN